MTPTADRMLRLAAAVFSGLPMTTTSIRRIHGVSRATAKRDLKRLRENLPVRLVIKGRRQVLVLNEE